MQTSFFQLACNDFVFLHIIYFIVSSFILALNGADVCQFPQMLDCSSVALRK